MIKFYSLDWCADTHKISEKRSYNWFSSTHKIILLRTHWLVFFQQSLIQKHSLRGTLFLCTVFVSNPCICDPVFQNFQKGQENWFFFDIQSHYSVTTGMRSIKVSIWSFQNLEYVTLKLVGWVNFIRLLISFPYRCHENFNFFKIIWFLGKRCTRKVSWNFIAKIMVFSFLNSFLSLVCPTPPIIVNMGYIWTSTEKD